MPGRFASRMNEHGVFCSQIQQQRWGLLTQVTRPGGGRPGVYQPRHARPSPNP